MSSTFAERLRLGVAKLALSLSAALVLSWALASAAGATTMVAAGGQAADPGGTLRAAASRGDLEAVRSLLADGIDADTANDYGATPLILACMRGHTEVVRLLLESGANAELADTFYGRSPLAWATEGGFEPVVALLFENGAGDFDQLFSDAVEAGDAGRVAELLSLHVPSAEVLSASLERAIATRNEALAEVLVNAGAVPPPPEIVDVDVDLLRLYEGNYVDEVGFELTVVADVQTKALLVRPPGVRNPLRFLPVEESTFISEQSESIYVRFVVRDGRVVSMSFTQAGATRRMTKR